MKILLLTAIIACSTVTFASTPNSAHSNAGTWQLDIAASDFGKEAAPKSMTLVVLEDTLEKFAFKVSRIEADGSQFNYEWHGAKDGAPQLVQISGWPDLKVVVAEKEVAGELIEHGIEADGRIELGHAVASPDGKTLQIDFTWIDFDGAETKQKWTWRRTK